MGELQGRGRAVGELSGICRAVGELQGSSEEEEQSLKQIVDRLRTAIFTDRNQLDPRTVVLISLANGGDLLNQTFGRKDVKARKKRIEQIVNGELTGKATREVIVACQTAMMVAAIMPAMMVATIHH